MGGGVCSSICSCFGLFLLMVVGLFLVCLFLDWGVGGRGLPRNANK